MQDGAEKEQRPSVLKETIRNLPHSSRTGSLWLIDNESAFMSAYQMMYYNRRYDDRKFYRFHKETLQSMCFFRRKTLKRVYAILQNKDPAAFLLKFINDSEPLFAKTPKLHEDSLFNQFFGKRLQEIWDWAEECQDRVGVDLRMDGGVGREEERKRKLKRQQKEEDKQKKKKKTSSKKP